MLLRRPRDVVLFGRSRYEDIIQNKQRVRNRLPLCAHAVAPCPIVLDNVQSQAVMYIFPWDKRSVEIGRMLVTTEAHDKPVLKPA